MEVSEIKEGRLASWQMDECAGWRKHLRFFLSEACRCDGAGNTSLVRVSWCVESCYPIFASPTCVSATWGGRGRPEARVGGSVSLSAC